MLSSLEISIQKDERAKVNQHFGSLMHGVLMQKINSQYAEYLHQNNLKPFSQYMYYYKERDCVIWKINTFNEVAKTNIIDILLNDTNDKLRVDHKNIDLKISAKTLKTSITYKDLSQQYFLEKPLIKKMPVNFLTPTTFKTNGNYVIFPEVSNIYFSLLNKWNEFSEEIKLNDKDVLEHLITNTKIIGYKLKSTKFEMEKIRINSFQGEVCLFISGPEALTRIANLLFAFSEYSGIGAKTALGMGGVRVE